MVIQKFKAKYIMYFVFGVFMFYLLYTSITPLTIAIDNGIARFTSVENFAKGDVTAGGTNIRFTERLPRVMKGVVQNPLTGLGFSDQYWEHADYHVGFATMLLQIGIFGYLFFIAFWIRFYSLFFRDNRQLYLNHPQKGALLIFPITLSSCLLLHFTSYQFMGFEYMSPPDYFFICFLFVFADISLKEARYINAIIGSKKKEEIEKYNRYLQTR
jgi:hypothetical protein